MDWYEFIHRRGESGTGVRETVKNLPYGIFHSVSSRTPI